MAFTYDVTTEVGKVRLLITDRKTPGHIFEDDEVAAFLSLAGDVVFMAAALALEEIAANQTLLLKRITLLDIKTDGPAVSAELRALAERLRWQAIEGGIDPDDSGFEIAEMVLDGFPD